MPSAGGAGRLQPIPPQERLRALRLRLWLERIVFIAIIVGLLVLQVKQEQSRWAYHIFLGKDPVALVATRGEAERIVEGLRQQLVPDTPRQAVYRPSESVERVMRCDKIVLPLREARGVFRERARLFAPGAVIMVRGRPLVALRSAREARECIESVQRAYGPGRTRIKEAWEIREINVEARKRLALEAAKEALVSPPGGRTCLVTPGMTAASIARRFGVSVGALQRANPGMDIRRLRTGAVVRIGSGRPLVTVVTVRAHIRREPIPFERETYADSDLGLGDRRITTQGRKGVREHVWEITLENGVEMMRHYVGPRVARQPVTERVAVGRAP